MNGDLDRDRFGEASDWFSRMRGADAEASREDFDVWRADPLNAAAYREIEAIWAISARGEAGKGRRRPQRLRPGLIAASLAAAVTIALFVHGIGRPGSERPGETFENDRSGLRLVSLPDGSKVTLDAASEIRTGFGRDERRVELLAGRARFDVAHGQARPFVVVAASHAVIARGTMFDVRMAGDRTEVALIAGAVDLERRGDGVEGRYVGRLVPGQTALFVGKDAAPRISAVKAANWTSGIFTAQSMPLADLVARANRSSSSAIVLADPSLGNLRVTGGFNLSDARSLAAGLAAALDLRVSEQASGRIVLSRFGEASLPPAARVQVGPTPEPIKPLAPRAMP
ncbi:FecR family protein [Novosphingobium sp. JCM 18896]|uniref:FecR family protein n=1 Tax=Novosphingobium sp. JCM 18896 TaxID=2989731 RepID=UPI002221F7D3|nr:FecR domain-containing protein [Novosphingobium sp. JCM 18896]MCW1430882.1 FecR domain-containing protein [Novosphingobium sp. JCM 18896]